jgi:F0F1-type ATP synthase membrane subunit c/vacuolar-type H+-ATPase subunit K
MMSDHEFFIRMMIILIIVELIALYGKLHS